MSHVYFDYYIVYNSDNAALSELIKINAKFQEYTNRSYYSNSGKLEV